MTDVTSSSATRTAVAASFDARAATYDQNAMHRELAVAVVRFCDLRGVRTVLDVATGTGMWLRRHETWAHDDGDVLLLGELEAA